MTARREKARPRLEVGVLYGFRALMVLAVVNYHIWQQSWLLQRVNLPGLLLDLGFSRDITDEVLAVTMDCEKRVMNVAHES